MRNTVLMIAFDVVLAIIWITAGWHLRMAWVARRETRQAKKVYKSLKETADRLVPASAELDSLHRNFHNWISAPAPEDAPEEAADLDRLHRSCNDLVKLYSLLKDKVDGLEVRVEDLEEESK